MSDSDKRPNAAFFDINNCWHALRKEMAKQKLTHLQLRNKILPYKNMTPSGISNFFANRTTNFLGLESFCEIAVALGLNPMEITRLLLKDRVARFKIKANQEVEEEFEVWRKKRGYNADGTKTLPTPGKDQ